MGGSPYPGLSVHQVIQFVTDGLRMTKTNEIPKAIYQIMKNCWQENPDARPTFLELHEEISALVDAPDDVCHVFLSVLTRGTYYLLREGI